MEHPFFPTTTTRVEALRWLSIAEKLLFTRDFVGSKSFATRARDSDPTLTPADQILAISDTLIASERRIGSNQPDWYAVLNLTPQQGQDAELVAAHYRNLDHLLNPQKNRFPFADEALRLVMEAFSVLSNPSKKSMFDKELSFTLPQQQSDPFGNPIHQNFVFFGGGNSSGAPQSHHFTPQAQTYASAKVEQVSATPVREPQNFMNFASGSTVSFGSGPGTKPSHEVVNKLTLEGHSSFGSNVPVTPVSVNSTTQKQVLTERSNVDAKSNHNVGVSERNENAEDLGRIDEQEGLNTPATDEGPSFWTACPYCYYMYEYPMLYVDCTLKCQNCKRAFQGIAVPSPPPISDGKEGFFCCWGFLPMGFSSENWEKMKSSGSTWTPFSPMFSCPSNLNDARKQTRKKTTVPRVYIDDDEDIVDLSDSSEPDDYDWNTQINTKRKKLDSVKRKAAKDTPKRTEKKVKADKDSNVNLPDAVVSPDVSTKTTGESSKKASVLSSRKQPGRAAKNCGKLDLNVECSNEAEEPPPEVDEQPGPSRGEDDNIEGIGFFEGLDEFLSSLPILNIVADDKVVKAT